MDNGDYVNFLGGVAKYVGTQLAGQFVHMFVFYPVFSYVCLKFFSNSKDGFLDGYRYFVKVFKAPLTAFTTSSSAATLPVTLMVVKSHGGVRAAAADLIVPLGSAINMDGTGLGFPVMVGFVAQAHGIDLTAGSYIL